MATQALRVAARLLHRELGVWLGGLFVLAGLTGSLLVFYPAIDGWLHADALRVAPAQQVQWERVLQTLRREFPTHPGGWRFELTPQPGAIPVRYYDPPETRGRDFAPLLAWVDPVNDRVLRAALWGDTLMTFVYDLHYRLLLDVRGAVLMGLCGLLLCLMLVAGMVAWWPRRGTGWRAIRLKPRAGRVRRLHDLHKLAGVFSLLVLLVVCVTGTMLEFPEQSRALMAIASPAGELPDPRSAIASGERISVDRALAITRAALPEATPAWIETPAGADGVYRVRVRLPGDPSRRFPHSFVWIDQYSGAVLACYDARIASGNDTVMNWLHALHNGEALGLAGRVTVLASGVFPLCLFVTGLMRLRARAPRGDARVL